MRFILIALAALFSLNPSANAQVFDFESLSIGAFTSINSTEGGVTLTATSTIGTSFVRTNNPANSLPPGMGTRALLGTLNTTLLFDEFTPIRMDFSSLLTSLSLIVGDGGGDDDGTVRIRAFNTLDVLLDQDSMLLGTSSALLTLSVTATDISYIIADSFGGPNNLNSVLWDNVTVSTVPEPSTIGLLAVASLFSIPTLRR